MDKVTAPLCIYHGNCADGFGAAWVVREYFKRNDLELPDFYPGVYQNPPPMQEAEGRDVIIVDFSYKRDSLMALAAVARTVIVLDHHKTAQAELEGLHELQNSWRDHMIAAHMCEPGVAPVQVLFDMERSGAMITWNYFFPDTEPPRLLKHIQDRDLWRFELPGTREIQANVFSYPYDFEVWDGLMDMSPEELEAFRRQGAAIERKHFKDIDELTDVATVLLKIGKHVVPAANLPYTMASDAGHLLSQSARPSSADADFAPPAFGATYWIGPEGVTFSLRSQGDFDVSAVAAEYGGGGHRNAAGFRTSYGDWLGMVFDAVPRD